MKCHEALPVLDREHGELHHTLYGCIDRDEFCDRVNGGANLSCSLLRGADITLNCVSSGLEIMSTGGDVLLRSAQPSFLSSRDMQNE